MMVLKRLKQSTKALASEDDLTRVLNYTNKKQNQTLNIMVLLRRKIS